MDTNVNTQEKEVTTVTIKQAVLAVYSRMPEKFYISTMVQPVRSLMSAGNVKKMPYDASIARKLRILNQRHIINYVASNTGIYQKLKVEETE